MLVRALVSLALLAGSLVASPARAAAAPLADQGQRLTAMFNDYGNTGGRWSGGDSTVSVALPDGRTAWIFSDTMLGTVNADFTRPRTSPMINNSLVVQTGDALTATLHGGTSAAPQALVKPAAAGEFYWVADATVEAGAVKVLYNRYRKTGEGALDVQLTGTALATLALPALTVSSTVELPVGSTVAWGNAVLEDGPYTYVYGSEYVASTGMRFAHVARVPAGGLGGTWQFWNGTTWGSTSARLQLSGVGTAFGVQKVNGQYVVVTVESNVVFGRQIVAYTAASPTGPFTGPTELFTAPEPAAREGVIVYDARLHPSLAEPGKLLVSYNVHSLNDDDLYDDARIYRPRFVSVTWPVPTPDPAQVPAAPAGFAATAESSSGGVRLSWTAPPGTVTTYSIYQRNLTAGQSHFARVAQMSETARTLGGFKTGNTYEFRVTASNSVGEGLPSATRTVAVTIAAPPAPTGLTATAGSDGSVTLNWAAVAYAWNYSVYRRDITAGETDFTAVSDGDSRDTTARALWLAHNHEYEFAVTATHGGGESVRSATARATARYAVPPAPAGLTAVPQSDGTIELKWSGPTENVYYRVYQRDLTAGDTAFVELPLPVGCCQLRAGYLAHDHEYEFKVETTNSGGNSPASNLARAKSTYPTPAAPTEVEASASNGQVRLNWKSNTPDTWYWVYQRDVTEGQAEFTRLPLPLTTCCQFTAGYLVNDHEYEFKVTAVAQGGESAASNTVRATPRLPLPPKVTGLTATTLSNGQIRLNWSQAAPDLYYWVYQRDVTAGESTYTKLPLPVGECCTHTAGLLLHNHVYDFKVAGTNMTGDGPQSDAARATARYSPPPAPTGLTAIAAGDGSIDLDWNSAGDGLYYWIYQRDVTAGQGFTKGIYPTDRTAHSVGPLVHGHVYEFKVSAENPGGEGATSGAASATSVGGLPLPPSNLTAQAGNGQVTLRWSASPSPSVFYWIEYKTASGSWQRLQYPLDSCCTFTVQYLANGTTYDFRIRATNVSGDSSASNSARARPLPPLPAAPTGLTATPGDGKVTLRWNASSSPDVYYWIEYRPAGGTWQRLKYPLDTCCTFTVGYLANGTYYEFRVRSTNLAGDSGPSVAAGAKPMPPIPERPSNLTATPSGDSAVRLTWTASPTPNVYYRIWYRLSDQENWTQAVYPVVCCDFTMSYLIPGRTYIFVLATENLAGFSTAPNPTAIATLTIITPAPVTGVRAVPRTDDSSVDVYWDPASHATGYTVQVKPCRGGSWSNAAILVTGTYARVHYVQGCYLYRAQADRYGKYGLPSAGEVIAFGANDDYPWGGWWILDPYIFVVNQCTSFVASRVDKYYKPANGSKFNGPNYGNAKNWDEAARKYGGAVSRTPAVGAIAQFNAGTYGHVAWVAGLDGSYAIIEEYNAERPEAYSRRRIPISSIDNFMYVT
ncbi:fibronectin type III domain-containing protein [Kribbella sp. NPDC005582]|uniref:fibronectin type III domain-containing protein n=1 Tax=Kribbella sp. NPDC005582 TaxID=3156893 RepID=UPI00339E8741